MSCPKARKSGFEQSGEDLLKAYGLVCGSEPGDRTAFEELKPPFAGVKED